MWGNRLSYFQFYGYCIPVIPCTAVHVCIDTMRGLIVWRPVLLLVFVISWAQPRVLTKCSGSSLATMPYLYAPTSVGPLGSTRPNSFRGSRMTLKASTISSRFVNEWFLIPLFTLECMLMHVLNIVHGIVFNFPRHINCKYFIRS